MAAKQSGRLQELHLQFEVPCLCSALSAWLHQDQLAACAALPHLANLRRLVINGDMPEGMMVQLPIGKLRWGSGRTRGVRVKGKGKGEGLHLPGCVRMEWSPDSKAKTVTSSALSLCPWRRHCS